MKLCTVCGVVTSRAGSRCADHARLSNRSGHNALYSTRAWLARPTGVGRAISTYTYEIPIEGRDEWLAAARRLA